MRWLARSSPSSARNALKMGINTSAWNFYSSRNDTLGLISISMFFSFCAAKWPGQAESLRLARHSLGFILPRAADFPVFSEPVVPEVANHESRHPLGLPVAGSRCCEENRAAALSPTTKTSSSVA